MPQRADSSHSRGGPSAVDGRPSAVDGKPSFTELAPKRSSRSAFLWLALFVLLINGSWAIYYFQFENLPTPLSTKEAGKRGFSEISALEHVKYLTGLGPHPVGSDPLDLAVQYVLAASEEIKKAAHWEVDVQLELFHAETGANRLSGGLFKGKTLIYSDLKHVVLRILPKYQLEARENAILVSSHIDTVFSTEGAGDCSSCVGVMLELARGISQWAHGFKSGVIFLFNTGEEEGLNGAHSFITQHPWARTVRFVVDLEAMGIGGKSIIFQSDSAPWAIESYAKVATYPSGQIIAQDFFLSGAIKSSTDFQVYKEVAGLPGLDFAYLDASAVYHTKNDKLKLLKPGSLQHLGENMLAFLRHTAVSPHLHEDAVETGEGTAAIFFDVLGMYMVAYRQRLASMVQNSVILQAVLIWTTSLLMGGYPGVKSLGLSCLSIIFMWVFSLILSVLVAFLLPHLSSSPIPYIANPWLLIGLFGAPSVLGALSGQHIGFILLQKYLRQSYSKRATNLPPNVQANLVNWEAERWLFKSGFVQSFFLLIAGNFFKIGSSYLALIWLVSPAFAYGLMEATLSPARAPRQLKITTLIMGLVIPFILSAGLVIQFTGTITANLVRFDRNPGSTPEWLGNVIVSVFIAAVVCLTLVYPLSYVHLSGSKRSIIFSVCAILGLTMIAISTGVATSFTEDIARTVNVVHVVKTTERPSEHQKPLSFVSIFSGTPGKLAAEMKNLNDEGFNCGRNETLDFVTFTVKYGCWTTKDSGNGWSESEIPLLHVEGESSSNIRKTRVFVDTKHSTRWALAINTQKIKDFTFEVNSEELVPEGDKKSVDGWHIIQFSGGRNSPTKFHLNLTWLQNATDPVRKSYRRDEDPPLLKLRTDVNRVTPVTARVLEKLPAWCSLFGKSTGPYTLAFLTSLPVNF